MVDFVGTKIEKGDVVIFTERDKGSLKSGIVMNFTTKKVKIFQGEKAGKTHRFPDEVVTLGKKAKEEAPAECDIEFMRRMN